MSLNMHRTQYGISQHNKLLQNVEVILVVQKNVNMQHKMDWFALYSVALMTAVRHVED